MLPDFAAGVHALLRLRSLDDLDWETQRPEWAQAALQRAPWVVVRRAVHPACVWPVGVRGRLRSERCAAWLPDRAVAECVTPQLLAASRAWHRHYQGERRNPALAVLDELAAIFTAHGHDGRWGPVGSVGFELATAVPSTTPTSDLDLVLQADKALTRSDAVRLHAELSRLPVRMDVLVETPLGAVALAEYAAAPAATLLRTAHGPRLVCDPWTAATASLA
jgi:phosphoribosyl-dephospho-CoA transferase